MTPAGGIGETMTHVAISQAKSLGEVYYSNRVLCLWPPGAEHDATRAVAGMADVISAMAERIEAEVHSDSLLCQFGAFDLGAWGNGVPLSKTGQRERASTVFQELLKRLSTLAKAHRQVREDQSEAASPLCDNFAALAFFYSGRTWRTFAKGSSTTVLLGRRCCPGECQCNMCARACAFWWSGISP